LRDITEPLFFSLGLICTGSAFIWRKERFADLLGCRAVLLSDFVPINVHGHLDLVVAQMILHISHVLLLVEEK
jgi:hypothetical protein